jgi:hypothetical protein
MNSEKHLKNFLKLTLLRLKGLYIVLFREVRFKQRPSVVALKLEPPYFRYRRV